MDKIEEFLESQRKAIADDREESLIALGLFEKEYAPDGKLSYQYKDFDIENGEKRYYRKKALPVTDDQWAEIVKTQEQLEEMEAREAAKEEAARKKEEKFALKKWIPVFVKTEDSSEGGSNVALALRVIAILWACIGGFLGVISLGEGMTGIILLASVVISVTLLYALAEILSYLAELTEIARGGFQFSNKK